MRLGSLFDGSGGFPLGGALCGLEPIWASEIEPFPIRVTTKRFPSVKHYGDISVMNGTEVEPVDVITFGSPCQDMSVAGKRAGMKHSELGDEEATRSGLFMEAVRIIREMQEATCGIFPRFAVWENVPGAFSSNKGEDFYAVIEELIKVADETAVIPRPPKGKWLNAGQIVGDGYSLAWRVLDAQYWGVPQRRRRIYLVADFAGTSAGEILFKREGLFRDLETRGGAGQRTAEDAEGCAGEANVYPINTQVITRHKALGRGTGFGLGACGDPAYTLQEGHAHGVIALNDQGGSQMSVSEDVTATLRAEEHGPQPCVLAFEPFVKSRRAKHAEDFETWVDGKVNPTLNTFDMGDVRATTVVVAIENHPWICSKPTLNNFDLGDIRATTAVVEKDVFEWHNQDSRVTGPIDTACTLNTNAGGREGHLVVAVSRGSAAAFKCGQGSEARSIGWGVEITPTLSANAGGKYSACCCRHRKSSDGQQSADR